ncbi:MAG: TIGR03790 family protein [Nitrospiraceae bacterium]
MIRSPLVLVGLLCLGSLIGTVQAASGELRPDQIGILANRNSGDSLAVARHYASRRGVPPEHILLLDLPLQDTISRDQYERRLTLPVRQALKTRGLAAKINTLVTTYGIPLRVQAPQPTDQEQRWREDAAERQRFARAYLEKIPEWAEKIAAIKEPNEDTSHGLSSSGATSDPSSESDQAMLVRLNAAVREAATRIQQARDREPPEKLVSWTNELARIMRQAGGMAALVQNLQASTGADPKQAQVELAQLKQQVTSAEKMIQVLNETPSDPNRKRAYQLAERVFGLQGILRLATAEVESFSYHAGDASVDSELSLLWWDSDMYPIAGRIPNPLHYEIASSTRKTASPLPVLMVSRLDAPTPELARRLVDQAIETEQRGLFGNVYIDARGLKPKEPLGYGFYDESLRNLADLFRRLTPHSVILEDTERRFSQPGEAPDVAVYVGWYRLRSYEDAFAFLSGAIGYHIASAEAISIHEANERGWCKNALERGITATLGSTGEPYLDAFPLPNDFFALLLTGRYNLVEAYAMTSRYTSWRMVLFGDPLYNPWRGKDLIKSLAGILRSNTAGHIAFPPAPSAQPATDPIKKRAEFREARKTVLSQVHDFLMQIERGNPSAR